MKNLARKAPVMNFWFIFSVFLLFCLRGSSTSSSSKPMSQSQITKGVDFESDEVIMKY